jgi:hypothetical protein
VAEDERDARRGQSSALMARRRTDLTALVAELNAASERIYRGELRGTTLYHYTDWRGAEGILTSRQMWATAHGCTNDPAEIITCDDVILDVATRLQRTAPAGASATTLDLFLHGYRQQRHRTGSILPLYLLCFSEARDDAEQWRRYGDAGRGICLGIPLVQEAKPESETYATQLVKVCYNENEMRKRLRVGFGNVSAVLAYREASREVKLHGLQALMYVASIAAMTTKRHEWAVEQEVRLVVQADQELVQERQSRGKSIRYVSIPLRAEGKRIALKEVIIGPHQDPAEAKARFSDVLNRAGYAVEDEEYPNIVMSELSTAEEA